MISAPKKTAGHRGASMTSIPPPGHKRRRAAGFSMRSLANHLDLPYGLIRRAVANGEITAITFGGHQRIPPSEAIRIAEMFGLSGKQDGNSNGIDNEDKEQKRSISYRVSWRVGDSSNGISPSGISEFR
jgi:hypothetical protein